MKNIFLIIFLFFIYSCGYSSVYKNIENPDLQIAITKMQGDKEINNLIKNELNLYSNKNSINKFNVTLQTKYNKLALAKNAGGVVTDYELSIKSVFLILLNEKDHEVTFNESIKIKNQTDTFEQNLYEKNIKRNFASSIRERLLSEIINLK